MVLTGQCLSLPHAGIKSKGLWIAVTRPDFSSLINLLSDRMQVITLPNPQFLYLKMGSMV